jgi:hypothetical protein
MIFHSMLFIKNHDGNNVSENGNLNIIGYIKCCELLMESLESRGLKFRLLTNDRNYVLENTKKNLDVAEIAAKLDVPEGIRFFGAHFKIDALDYLGSLDDGEYHVLIDSDVICINDLPVSLLNIEKKKLPMYFDITDQVFPAYGQAKIIMDKEKIMDASSLGLWAGGEFLAGDSEFFSKLYDKCMRFWTAYKEKYPLLRHQGDEMLVSCAIEEMLGEGIGLFDAGKLGVMYRHWSVKTLHISKPLEAAYKYFLIHLPADKDFLGSGEGYSGNTFPGLYLEYLDKRDKKKSLFIRAIKKTKSMIIHK